MQCESITAILNKSIIEEEANLYPYSSSYIEERSERNTTPLRYKSSMDVSISQASSIDAISEVLETAKIS
jgi:hypothetical protein